MKILLDECLPKDLKNEFPGHDVRTVREMKWDGKLNGELLSLIIKHQFEVFVTIDSNLKHQQNLKKFPGAIVSIKAISNDIDVLVLIAKRINNRIKSLKPNRIYEF